MRRTSVLAAHRRADAPLSHCRFRSGIPINHAAGIEHAQRLLPSFGDVFTCPCAAAEAVKKIFCLSMKALCSGSMAVKRFAILSCPRYSYGNDTASR